jgi:hypothetical protein
MATPDRPAASVDDSVWLCPDCYHFHGKDDPCPSDSGSSAATTDDPLVALEEKWRTEPADLAEWANRATRTLALARRWRQAAREWEEQARKERDRG